MDELDQSPLVSSSSSSGPVRPQQPQFNYQFVLDDEKEEEEEEEEEEDEDEDFDEQLEVMERKPATAPAAALQERPPQLLDLGGPAEPPRPAAPEPPHRLSPSPPPRPGEEGPPPARLVSTSAPGPGRAAVLASRAPPPESLPFSLPAAPPGVVDLLYWRDIKKTGVVFGASLFLLLSLTVFSIVSVTAYIALALLSVTISFRIYKGVIQAIQKSDEGHPFRAYLESDVAVSEELIQKYSNVVLGHVNGTVKELRRLFLVDDLVDSLKFAVLMWVFTYVGALFNGLTLLILAGSNTSHLPFQAQIDHYLGLVNKNVKDAMAKIQAKIPGLKRKTE
uniref:Reticulon n=1 Tax=Falco tinnunculus TaxID=100819 RepID=A0A8C4XND8_FALTI